MNVKNLSMNSKRILTFLLALVLIFTTVVVPTETVSAAKAKTVKSVTLKISSKNVTKKTYTMNAGTQNTIKVSVSPSSAKKKITYKSSKTSVAAVSSKGVVKAKKAGTAKITVTVTGKDNKKKSTYVKIKVKKASIPDTTQTPDTTPSVVEVTEVAASILKGSITVGESTQIITNVTPENATNKSLTYTSENPAVAVVNELGVVTGIGAGSTNITVKSANGKTATVKVTVVNVPVNGIKLSESALDITVSGNATLKVTVTPANATNTLVDWESKDPEIASVTQEGLVTGHKEGTTTVTATAKDGSGVKASCTVKVSAKATLVDGVSVEMTNPYTDKAGKEYANTALVGDDMTIRARVVKNGQPVGNASVSLTIEPSYGNCPKAFAVLGNTNVNTDSNGYANFAIGLKDAYNDYDAVSNLYQSLKVTAKESGSNTEQTITVKYGSIELSGVSVLNGTSILYPDIVPSDNASAEDDGIHTTYYLDEEKTQEEYVSSQQVSSADGKENHKVYLTAAPFLVLPAAGENVNRGEWKYEVENGTSGPCSVYNDDTNETTTVQVTSIPSGLQFITLKFDKISLSKYTTMNIDVYNALTGERIYHVEKTTEERDSEGKPTIQIPIQKDIASRLVVSLVSQGQVDTTSTGYVLTELVGVWASESNEDISVEEIAGTVNWTDVSAQVLYETNPWSYEDASDYLPEGNFLNTDYKYSYKVPVFPYTGDAIIVVKDSNDTVLANFLYPTENNGENVNVLAPKSEIKAIHATNEEITNKVGTLVTEGNMAIVDSTQSGSKALQAKVTVAGLNDRELNEQNGGILYTSVQWAPIPTKEEEKNIPDFFAIEGQNVTVTAKLFDKNGNESASESDANKKVTFKVKGEEVDLTGTTIGSDATLVDVTNSGATDDNGEVKLTISDLTNNDYYSLVEELTAEAAGYTVKLKVADEDYVEAADIYWVDLGISYVNSAVASDNPVRTTQFENSAMPIENAAEYVVSDTNGWQIGYQMVARSFKFPYPFDDKDDYTQAVLPKDDKNSFVALAGVSVVYNKDSEYVTLDTTTQPNVAILNTTIADTAVLTGTLKVDDPSAVKFTFKDEDGNVVTYKNIGVGTPTIEGTGLKLTTKWNTDGINVELIAPKNVYVQTAATAYVVVTDKHGNAIPDASVEYTITGLNATDKVAGKTDSKGVLAIPLAKQAVSGGNVTSVISVTVNSSIKKDVTVSYVPASANIAKFVLREETATKFAVTVGADKKTINVYFSNAVDKDTINKGQFKFVQDGSVDNTYKVELAEMGSENTCVTLTLDKAIVSDGAAHTLSIGSYTDTKTGVKYTLMDSNGQMFTDTKYNFKPNERSNEK